MEIPRPLVGDVILGDKPEGFHIGVEESRTRTDFVKNKIFGATANEHLFSRHDVRRFGNQIWNSRYKDYLDIGITR